MNHLLASELLKLRTTRVVPALLAASVGLSVLTAALIVLLSGATDLSGQVGARLVLSSGGIAAGILTLLLGIVTTAGEYRHGTIVPTLLVTPHRLRVTLGQIVACTVAGTVIGAASVSATAVVALPLLAARDIPHALSTGQLTGIVLGGICFAALSGALGAALGALVRHQVVAVAMALVALFLVEPILTESVDGYQRYSLTGLRTAMSGGAAEGAGDAAGGLPPFWLAAVLWTGYTVVLAVAASAIGRRRDVQ